MMIIKGLKLKFKNNQKGFTVVELIVAMSVFIVLMTIAVGVFIQGLRSQRLLTYLMAINNNAGLTLEQMIREIRTGYNFNLAGASLVFTNFEHQRVTYELQEGRIKKITSSTNPQNPDSVYYLSAPDVNIKYLSFIIGQRETCDPWRITVLMEVASRKTDIVQTVPLQTTVSSRILPIEVPGASQSIIDRCRR